ncbi:Hint domain-containing protein [Ruegeria marina]|uniref:Hint domain-containing protein n=1 Tax=Ruegeria marina TaxID=639004 RepID=A0A1G6L8G8_9RHOB|nr:Hint domain-containing protein [Ruegeria marina]SDC39428.1 Hint domain-containing protein [Ruegeria marina]
MAAFEGLLITGQSGFLAGTCIASTLGWKPVEQLKVGDRVLTFDNAMQPIMDIQRERMIVPDTGPSARYSPVRVPEGALFNRRDIWLMPEQGMLIECDAALDTHGDPYAVIPARYLRGFRGIAPDSLGSRFEVTTLAFRQDEVIYVEGGLLAYCPQPRQLLDVVGAGQPRTYEVLEGPAAQFLVNCLIDDDDIGALGCDPADVPGLPKGPVRPGRPMAPNPFD